MTNNLGESIKKYRQLKNLSVRKLAGLMFISPATVSRWETGAREPGLDALYRLSEVLEIDLSCLLSENKKNTSDHEPNVLFITDTQDILDGIMKSAEALIPAIFMHGFISMEEALKYASLHPVDIAFIDIRMRGEKGIALARDLQSGSSRTNIIFLADTTKYMPDAWELHASGYLLKPLDPDNLRQELTNLRFAVNRLSL